MVPGPDTCREGSVVAAAATRDERWLRNARYARWLAWASLVWMGAEGVVGLLAGVAAGSIALVGWALGSGIEAVASVIVVWRFTGSRVLSETAERRAQKAVAVGSGATVSEGTQNLICAAQAAAVLLALAVVAIWPGGWPIDPIIALGIAGWSVWEGNRSWQGADCC